MVVSKKKLFTPNPGEMIQIDLRIFFKWVVQPSTRQENAMFTSLFEGELNLRPLHLLKLMVSIHLVL